MDATTRWETEALRTAPVSRTSPPKPSRTRAKGRTPGDAEWVTLKEAERATGIPTNTLRKWVRRNGLASYLESDGEMQVRMVDLGAVRERARALGRRLAPPPAEGDGHHPGTADPAPPSGVGEAPAAAVGTAATVPDEHGRSGTAPPPGTMIVPVDAWNKMLAQLGNLHEAGQQLAEARERAAKAETEAAFLRERLAEMRSGRRPGPWATDDADRSTDTAAGGDGDPIAVPPPQPTSPEDGAASDGTRNPPPDATTTYWRYLTTGWRRRRGRGDRD